jgi:hypothetical protein
MSMKLDSLFNDAVRETIQARKGSTSVLRERWESTIGGRSS